MEIVTINAMWCPGCIVMHKVWDEIKKEYKDIKFNSSINTNGEYESYLNVNGIFDKGNPLNANFIYELLLKGLI